MLDPAARQQLRKHIAAIDGRRPENGHSPRGFSECPHPDCAKFHHHTQPSPPHSDEYYLAMAALDLYPIEDGFPKSTSITFRIHQLGHALVLLTAALDPDAIRCRYCGEDLRFIRGAWLDRETHSICDPNKGYTERKHEPLPLRSAGSEET